MSRSPPQAELDGLNALFDNGRLTEVIDRGERLSARFPESFVLQHMLGTANGMLGRDDRATAHFRRALQVKPDFAMGHVNLGVALERLDRKEEAAASYERALELQPDNAEAHHCLGSTLHALGRLDDAVASYGHALRIRPDHVAACYNRGIALEALGRADEAVAHFRRALRIQPDFADAHYNLGIALQAQGRIDEAIASYHQALRIKPDFATARSQRLHQLAHICDWNAIDAEAGAIGGPGLSGGGVMPFTMLAFDDNPAVHRQRAENYSADSWPAPFGNAAGGRPSKPGIITIGYFSADFYNHATMYLMARLFALHDRDRFAVHAFSYWADGDDEMRRKVRNSVDAFHDVRSMGDRQVAEFARLQGIDIAIDLKGYTAHARPGIFAWRAAPIQMSYLGYPGTLGAPFIDYLVADRVVIPQEQRQYYSEKIIFLPNSYQVNDNSRPISDRKFTRAELGLPENGFVFCSFNNSYKISPVEFDIWMRLLHQVDGSVLWLFRANKWVEGNLRNEAQKRGIEAHRLVFADLMPLPEHLARHAQADLFLDTFNVNAHTTASDALWAGLPLVTKRGQGFAARVAASLLNAVGLPELIASTSAEYERLALELAGDPHRLTGIRAKLASNRLTAPLFDTKLFTHDIEAAYQRAYESWAEGRPPADIDIGQVSAG